MSQARVLIVEDQSGIAIDLKNRLTGLGYTVLGTVSTGNAVIELAATQQPDVILMDIVLKGQMDAIEAAARIRADYHIPIVYITAHSDDLTLQHASAAEPYGYLLKPFEDSELRSVVEVALYKHRLERQLAAREGRFRSLLEHASDIIVVVDASGRVTYFSPASARLFSSSPQTSLEALLPDFVAPADVARLVALWREVQAQPGAQRSFGECRVRVGDGTWHTLTGRLTNLLGEAAVQGIVINAHDITPQKNAEETLQRLFIAEQRHARELAALNMAFRAMSSSLEVRSVLRAVTREMQHLIGAESVSVLLRDDDELVFAAATGPGSDQLIGTRMPAVAGVAGAVLQSQIPSVTTNAAADTRFFNAIDAQTGLTTQTILAVPLVLAGEAIGVMEAINKAHESFGAHDLDLMVAIAGSAAIAIENARLFEAQREHNRRLHTAQPQLIQTEKMAALGRLTASLAHEINNPLQVVQGCLTLIDETLAETQFNGQVRDTLRRDLLMAVTEVDRMAVLIRRLRDFYQPARASTTITELSPVISTVLEVTAQQLDSQQIRVERQVAWKSAAGAQELTDEPQVAADPDHVKQVLLYLVLNAIDAMPGGGRLRIDTGLDERGGHDGAPARPGVRIAVGDTGPLIPAALLARAFEPFYTVRATQSSLGPAMCYELVTSLGGEISVTSEAAEGTVFTVWLPIAPDQHVNAGDP